MQVLAFLREMGLFLPQQPPLMLVDESALNEAGTRQGAERPVPDPAPSGGAASLHTRGLTLTQEWRQLRTVMRMPQGGALWATAPSFVDVPAASGCEV